jgi:HEAT repeat protein
MQAELQTLIDQMTAKEKVANSEQSISWHAHRMAERLADENLIGDLELALSKSKSKNEKRALSFILGAIGANTGAVRCAEILIHRLTIETDKYFLAELLNSLSKINKPKHLDLKPIYHLLREPRWLVRYAAITALQKTSSSEAENQILMHLSQTDDPHDKIYCHATLNKIGTIQAIPLISASLTSRKPDVKMSAEEAMRSIEARHAKYNA